VNSPSTAEQQQPQIRFAQKSSMFASSTRRPSAARPCSTVHSLTSTISVSSKVQARDYSRMRLMGRRMLANRASESTRLRGCSPASNTRREHVSKRLWTAVTTFLGMQILRVSSRSRPATDLVAVQTAYPLEVWNSRPLVASIASSRVDDAARASVRAPRVSSVFERSTCRPTVRPAPGSDRARAEQRSAP